MNRGYSGYMKFPLAGATSQEEFWSTCEYEGDFVIPARRVKILSKPRHFRLQVHLKQGEAFDIIDLTPQKKIGKLAIAELLFKFASDDLDGHEMDGSFFKVII